VKIANYFIENLRLAFALAAACGLTVQHALLNSALTGNVGGERLVWIGYTAARSPGRFANASLMTFCTTGR
jgi:hypothetical protein